MVLDASSSSSIWEGLSCWLRPCVVSSWQCSGAAITFLGALPSSSAFSPSLASCFCCFSFWSGRWRTTHLCHLEFLSNDPLLSGPCTCFSSRCQTFRYVTAPNVHRTDETDMKIVWSIHTHVLPNRNVEILLLTLTQILTVVVVGALVSKSGYYVSSPKTRSLFLG
jgi:hypothetical protein